MFTNTSTLGNSENTFQKSLGGALWTCNPGRVVKEALPVATAKYIFSEDPGIAACREVGQEDGHTFLFPLGDLCTGTSGHCLQRLSQPCLHRDSPAATPRVSVALRAFIVAKRQGPAERNGATVSGQRKEKPRKARVCYCLKKNQSHGYF